MKNFFILLFYFLTNVCLGQVSDFFSDADFTSSPVWNGSTSHFIVNASGQLQLNNSVAGTSYLSVPLPPLPAEDLEWSIWAKQSFASSGSNFGRVYLWSDHENLTQPLNGYYLQLGEAGANDAVELFRQSGTVSTSVCRASAGMIAASFSIRIRVTRDASASWKIEIDYTGGQSFLLEASGNDATFTTGAYAGISCVYTAGNANKFFFDDFYFGAPLGDQSPPMVNQVVTLSATSLDLFFSEPVNLQSAQNTSLYRVDEMHPGMVTLSEDQMKATLAFDVPFRNGKLYSLNVSGIQDLSGNAMTSADFPFRYFVMEPARSGDIVFNELFADPSPQIGLPTQEFVEVFNASEKAFNLSGWKLQDATTTAVLPVFFLLPGEYLIVTSTAAANDYSSFGNAAVVTNFPTLNNSGDVFVLRDAGGLAVDSVNYAMAWYQDDDKAQGGFTLERLNPKVNTNEPTNWMASLDEKGGTPGKVNSVFGRNPDSIPPTLTSVNILNNHELKLQFSERMDSLIFTTGMYTVDLNVGAPLSASSSDNQTVLLLFESHFQNGVDYHLKISGLTDMAGNVINPVNYSFRFFVAADIISGAIVFNEIMADPAPIVQLPEAEFIELYNRSENPYDLTGWKLSDATSTVVFPSFILLPGSYLIVTASSNASKFLQEGKVIGLSGFPSLANAGEVLILRTPNNVVMDSMQYKSSWYQDDNKKDGGWTLERLRPAFGNVPINWRASVSDQGGTPGKVNSLFGKNPDSVPPEIEGLIPTSKQEVMVRFNEPMDAESVLTTSHYAINDFGNPVAVSLSEDRQSVSLHFENSFSNGSTHWLLMEHLADTAGNEISTARSFTYFIPSVTLRKDVIITEIMADPTPVVQLPEVEYVEIFNRSNNPVNLDGWRFSDARTTAFVPAIMMMPGEYLVLTSPANANRFSGNVRVVGVLSFPSLQNEGESLQLKTPLNEMVDSVNYSISWYGSDNRKEGGWSLELIDPSNPCGEGDNWAISEDDSGGTPGRRNSVWANKPDLQGPRLKTLFPKSDKSIEVLFDEKLGDILSGQFIITPPLEIGGIHFTDPSLRTIRITFASPIQARTLYSLRIESLTDCNGNLIDEAFASADFALPEPADQNDVVISEILFNPRPLGVDFIEVFNQSEKYISLKDWKLARPNTSGQYEAKKISDEDILLEPKTFRLFTSNAEVVAGQYPVSKTENFYQVSLPPMPDEEGEIVILNNEDKVIDKFTYSAKMHSPLVKDEEGVSLERIDLYVGADEISNWRSGNASTGFATPGFLNSNSRSGEEFLTEEAEVVISPQVISSQHPDRFTQIKYRFDSSGLTASVLITDLQGRIIREIANNQSVGLEGFFRWDGDRDDGTLARTGAYTVYFRVFDLSGSVRTFRKRVIVYN